MQTSIEKTISEVVQAKDSFRYQLLSRLQQDCDFYLGNGNRDARYLWALNEDDHIQVMTALWHSFDKLQKPEWLTLEDIQAYQAKFRETK